MKLGEILIIVVVGLAALMLFAPSVLPNLVNSQLVEGQQVTISGKLALVANPPLSQIVLPVEVWQIQETILSIPTGRCFYLSRSGAPIMVLGNYTVGQTATATGKLHITTDVNLNKVYLIDYTSLAIQK